MRLMGAESGRLLDVEVVLELKLRIKIIDIITHYPNDCHSDHTNLSGLAFKAAYLAGVKLFKTDYLNIQVRY